MAAIAYLKILRVPAALAIAAIATFACGRADRGSSTEPDVLGQNSPARIIETSSEPENRASTEAEIRELTQQWIAGWSPGEAPFDVDKLRPLYARGENAILVYDDIGEDVAVIRSWEEYARLWQPFMEQFAYWSIRAAGDIEITVGSDFAMSNFVWIGEARYRDGREATPKQYATLVWQRQDDSWVIVHEHLTAAANP